MKKLLIQAAVLAATVAVFFGYGTIFGQLQAALFTIAFYPLVGPVVVGLVTISSQGDTDDH